MIENNDCKPVHLVGMFAILTMIRIGNTVLMTVMKRFTGNVLIPVIVAMILILGQGYAFMQSYSWFQGTESRRVFMNAYDCVGIVGMFILSPSAAETATGT